MSGIHGTVDGYRKYQCRCDDCLSAFVAWVETRAVSIPTVERNAAAKGTPRCAHGTLQRYRAWGCRCEQCRSASAAHRRQSRAAAKARAS